MMTPLQARPPVRPLPPVAVTIGMACVLLWLVLSAIIPDISTFQLADQAALGATGRSAAIAALAALALAIRHLLVRLGAPQPDRAAALVLLMPSALIGAGVLGECEAIWAALCIMALTAAVDRKPVAMLLWSGVALGLTTQALLFIPFVIALLIARRVPLRLWLAMPLVAAATALTVSLLGWPVRGLALASFDAALAINAPNIWQIVEALPLIGTLPLGGLALAGALGAGAAYVAWLSTRRLDGRGLLAPALLAPMIMAGLLPHMHQGSFFLADILALVMALTRRDRTGGCIAALVQTGSFLALLGHLAGLDALAVVGAIPMIAATVQVARPLLRPFTNDNPSLART